MAKLDGLLAIVDLILIGVVSYLAVTSDGWWWIIVGILASGFLFGFFIRNFRTISGKRSN